MLSPYSSKPTAQRGLGPGLISAVEEQLRFGVTWLLAVGAVDRSKGRVHVKTGDSPFLLLCIVTASNLYCCQSFTLSLKVNTIVQYFLTIYLLPSFFRLSEVHERVDDTSLKEGGNIKSIKTHGLMFLHTAQQIS